MNISQGPHYIDDTLTFSVTTHDAATAVLTDADSVPSFRVYEDETGTAILTGSMAKLDDTNTTGFYSEQLTLSAANGFEAGKSYQVYVSATVDSVVGGTSGGFRLSGVHPVNVTQVSGDSTAADNLESYLDGSEFMPVDAHKQDFDTVTSPGFVITKKPDGTTDTPYSPKTLTTDPAAEPITGSS